MNFPKKRDVTSINIYKNSINSINTSGNEKSQNNALNSV
ncbi:hypothetical protein NLA_8840 [Neisseria lactamica 020-06]|uniref:Uncharacterized protein n=1 Tax=Neisseria lactamica (strain 020-06) TaxID=489653 RepID=E4ZCN2_NEIL0|nr:hypothetical protein NLA_8840 [Neisseria lactamica 020-06]